MSHQPPTFMPTILCHLQLQEIYHCIQHCFLTSYNIACMGRSWKKKVMLFSAEHWAHFVWTLTLKLKVVLSFAFFLWKQMFAWKGWEFGGSNYGWIISGMQSNERFCLTRFLRPAPFSQRWQQWGVCYLWDRGSPRWSSKCLCPWWSSKHLGPCWVTSYWYIWPASCWIYPRELGVPMVKKNIDLRCLQENLELVEWSQFNKVKFSN